LDRSLDIESRPDLLRYLRHRGIISDDDRDVETRILKGGVSGRLVLIRPLGSEAFVVKQALPKLRTPVDWFSPPERIWREVLGTRWLAQAAPEAITPVVFEDRENYLIAIAAVPEPHHNWKTMLLEGDIDLVHVEQFAALLAKIHRTSAEQRNRIAPQFEDRAYFESLRLEPYYRYPAAQLPEAAPFLHQLIDATLRTRECIVHGDYSPKNVLIHAAKVVLLDHEVIHWGDPAFDVGFSLTHLLSKANHLLLHRDAFVRAAQRYVDCYLDAVHFDCIESRAVRHTIACLLARVAGRSPLEYLTAAERTRQQTLALRLMTDPPVLLRDLLSIYREGL